MQWQIGPANLYWKKTVNQNQSTVLIAIFIFANFTTKMQFSCQKKLAFNIDERSVVSLSSKTNKLLDVSEILFTRPLTQSV